MAGGGGGIGGGTAGLMRGEVNGGRQLPSCCLMILNYNGQELLRECLPSALAAADAFEGPCPVVVVDNQSTEGDLEFLAKTFPEVEAVSAERNDYLFSLNAEVAKRSEDVVIILNNDMTFDEGFIAPLLRYFDRPEIFAVTARVFDWDRESVITARSRLVRKKLWYSLHRTFHEEEPCFTFYAAGGAAAFRRSMYLELGGFDPLFRPAYYEEVDLSYRAWKRGWKVIYEPASIMIHRRAATLGKQHSKERLQKMICRNQVLFNLKDTGTFLELAGFLALLPIRFLRARVSGDAVTAGGILQSLARLPQALGKRFLGRSRYVVSDLRLIHEIEHGEVFSPATGAEEAAG